MKEQEDIFTAGGEPPVFRRAIVAVGFSPHLHAVLNHSQRLLKNLGTDSILLHVGQNSQSVRKRLVAAISASQYNGHYHQLVIRPGLPVDVIPEVARQHRADLIIAGAAKKESLLRHFLGSVAAQLAWKSPCSLLLLTDPSVTPGPIARVHCAVEYDRPAHFAIQLAMGLAAKLQSRELVLTHSFRVEEWEGKGRALPDDEEIRRIYRRQDARLRRFLARFLVRDIPCRSQCFYEHSLTATLSFARDLNANLLIIPGPRRQFGIWDRLLKDNLAHLFQTLPDAILLTRKPRYRLKK